jgi:transcriptional regulator with XRE-family HTH domain
MTAGTLARMSVSNNRVGGMLRDWRRRRRMSQLDLALETGISTRHLSFVETGRSRPSNEMVVRLADRLEVPLRERNQLLVAAGYAPQYGARSLDDTELAPIRDALLHVLTGHEPYPALAIDRRWNLVASNSALDLVLEGVAEELLQPPANTLRLALHPNGMAPRVVNLGEWRDDLLRRLERQILATGDPELIELREELLGYPGPAAPQPAPASSAITMQLRLRSSRGELAFFSTVTTFGTAVDITVSELAVEALFPADAATGAALGGV